MENAFEHLRLAVARCLTDRDTGTTAANRLLDGFRVERPAQEDRKTFRLPFPPALLLRGADWLLRDQRFNVGKGIDAERGMIQARVERDLSGAPWIAALGSPRRDWRVSFAVEVRATEDSTVHMATSRHLPGWIAQFQQLLEAHMHKTYQPLLDHGRAVHEALAAPVEPVWCETILGPGEMLSRPFRGTLRDYSGCATEAQTRDLRAECGGVLPLGRQHFERGYGNAQKGAPLFLSPNRNTRALREHQGTLICAPQNSGKTELLVRWAKAANKAGYNLFLVDVKGNLLRRLMRDGKLHGEVYHFTTDPLCHPGDAANPCHALNFLDRLDPWSPLGIQRIRQLAEAVLPTDGLESGEVKLFRENWVNWLTTFIHLVLLDEFYTPIVERRADLSDVCELASDEDALVACLRRIAAAEVMNLAEGRQPPSPRLSDLFGEISVLLPQEEIVPECGDMAALYGRRSEHSYRWLTETLAGMLRSFRSYGLLGDKISGAHDLPRFSLEWVAGLDDALRPSERQVTVILAARQQEGDEARTILTLAIARLQQALLERMRHAGDRTMRPVLLLLDETRRIRNFRTNEYVSYAREAEAGCVVVYQSLDQVGTESQVAELLENIGTQIYLGSLVRNTARHFVASLPKRHRPSFTLSSGGTDGMGGVQIGQEVIDYFSTADLYVLPAGSYPALVQLNDQPRRRPVLVSLDWARGETGA
ncbi:MAG TPA: type IV secretory system conjugative DNA transfer family protein [Acetobacteraceae bacterium]|nr:type IV secretory system conjugative DNA transfer family protein [Acetobacteraceae bacterium]